jgi:hypothetical protein
MGLNWSKPVSNSEAHRRAAGRRHYNAWRKFLAITRQNEVAKLSLAGIKPAEIARRLKVSRATICRDMATLRAGTLLSFICPCCRQFIDDRHRLVMLSLERGAERVRDEALALAVGLGYDDLLADIEVTEIDPEDLDL